MEVATTVEVQSAACIRKHMATTAITDITRDPEVVVADRVRAIATRRCFYSYGWLRYFDLGIGGSGIRITGVNCDFLVAK